MTFKQEIFDLLYNNTQLKLQDLYKKYPDRTKGVLKAYYYEYKRTKPICHKILTINELLTFLEQEIKSPKNKGTANRRECIKLYIEMLNATGNDIKQKTIIEQFTEWKETNK